MKPSRREPERTLDDSDAILLRRFRAGLWVLLVAFVLFSVVVLRAASAKIPALTAIKAIQLATVLAMFWLLRRPRSRPTVIVAALATVVEVAATNAANGIVIGETASIFVLMTVVMMWTAALLPWGAWAQTATVAAVLAAISVNILGVERLPQDFEPFVVGVVTAAIASIYIAYEFERHRIERLDVLARLRDSEARSRAIIDTALDGIITMDGAGNIRDFNPAAERAFGYAREDVIGRSVLEALVPRRLRAEYRHRFAKYLATGERVSGARVKVLSLRADGSEFPGELAINRSDYGRATLVTGYLRDLTERKLAEEARTSAALVRVGREMMASLDTALIVDRLSLLTTEVLGCDWSATFLHDRKANGYARVATYPRSTGPAPVITDAEMSALTAHFRRHDVMRISDADVADAVPHALRGREASAVCCGLWRDDDTLAGLVVAGYDSPTSAFSTEQETIVGGIAQIASLALNNTRLVEQLEHASRIKSEFLSTMSHELRTPLNAILGYTEMVEDDACDRDEQLDCLNRIKDAGRQLLELIEGTLEIGRIEAGQSEVRLMPVALRSVWTAAYERCSLLRTAPDVTLEWRDAACDATLVTDARKLVIVLRNLVENALKFTTHGRVRVEAACRDDAVTFEVEDTGIGIAVEDKDIIFDMFRQADGSESRHYAGTGLGLYIVRRFMQQLGGTVIVESTPGKGSCFTVVLPRTDPGVSSQRVA